MGRPKEFDREQALAIAIDVFGDHGFEGTSTETLLKAMNLNRQSLYDTYGSKRALYLEALRRYTHGGAERVVRDIAFGPTPFEGLKHAMLSFAQDAADRPNAGCLGVSSILEFGLRDADVLAARSESHEMWVRAIADAVASAQASGEIRHDIDVRAAADFLLGTFAGLKVSARGGMPADRLCQMALLALQALTAAAMS